MDNIERKIDGIEKKLLLLREMMMVVANAMYDFTNEWDGLTKDEKEVTE